MNSKALLPIAAVALLTLAACSDPETPADATTETPAAEIAPPAEAPAPVPPEPAMAPAAEESAMTPEQAMQAVQTQAASMMSDEQKEETIATARKTAEDAAIAQGLTPEQVEQAGDMAEQATRQMLGLE